MHWQHCFLILQSFFLRHSYFKIYLYAQKNLYGSSSSTTEWVELYLTLCIYFPSVLRFLNIFPLLFTFFFGMGYLKDYVGNQFCNLWPNFARFLHFWRPMRISAYIAGGCQVVSSEGFKTCFSSRSFYADSIQEATSWELNVLNFHFSSKLYMDTSHLTFDGFSSDKNIKHRLLTELMIFELFLMIIRIHCEVSFTISLQHPLLTAVDFISRN